MIATIGDVAETRQAAVETVILENREKMRPNLDHSDGDIEINSIFLAALHQLEMIKNS